MKSNRNSLVLIGLVVREGDGVYSLCPELDVASQGKTISKAKAMLREAVSGYLETCFESHLPYPRPTPPDDDRRRTDPNSVVATFRIKVNLAAHCHDSDRIA